MIDVEKFVGVVKSAGVEFVHGVPHCKKWRGNLEFSRLECATTW